MPRAGLTTLRVVQEAEEVADEVGLTNLTLAAIAPRLGVRMPSLYKHVDGIDALRRLVAIRACHELADVLARAAAGKAGAEAVQAMSNAYRAWANEHPGRYAATVHWAEPGDTEHLEANHAIVAIAVAALASYKMSGDDAIDAIRAIRATVHGFVSLEQANGFGLPANVDRSFDRLIMGLATTLDSWAADQTTTTQGVTS
jgi:AcrR family transcriptional regulator